MAEESPGTTGQIAGETSGAGNREDSATEMKTADGCLTTQARVQR